MRNPIYTVNDLNLYRFYKSKGSNLKNTSEEYDGEHSLYLFSGENTNRKTWDLSGQNIVIAPHKGFIPSDIWLFCRKKILANHQVKTCKAKNSFLAGKLKCGNCGYGLAIRKSQRAGREPVRYFVDMGWTEHHCCPVKLSALRADEIEALVVERITDKVNELNIHPKQERSNAILESIVTLEGRIEELKSQIDGLLDMLCGNDISPITVKHVNERIDKLGREQVEAEQQLAKLQSDIGGQSETEHQALSNVMSHWNELTFDDKRAVVELLIEKIVVTPEKLEFIWKV